jgi:hypothetical protein
MIVSIRYWNPQRPGEASLVFFCELTHIEQTKTRLAKLGFTLLDDEAAALPLVALPT